MIKFKAGVNPTGIRPELWHLILVMDDCYSSLGFDCVVTSLNDGHHSVGSKHWSGEAADFRTVGGGENYLWSETAGEFTQTHGGTVVALAKEIVPVNLYDIILEPDHIHGEWHPKRGS